MKSIRKIDAIPKLNGSWKFLDDYSYVGMIHGQLLYSTCHHGFIKKITFPDGYNLSEFTMVSTRDIPGKNIVPEPECDQPYMASKEVTHFGQVIMGITHPSKETLKNFMKQIKVEYEELPAIIDVKECLENENNSFGKEIIIDHRKNVKTEKDWVRTHSVYYTAHQEQAYLEPQGMIAIYKPEEKNMFVRGTMQCPFFVKDGVEAIMGNTIKEAIIETSEGIGGAFGGKEDFPSLLAGITALLAYKSGNPVKIVLVRADDIQIT
ncbi:MAG: xanthine dehydrogenase family protein molybdopterin-binding subunit, partial [Candidatus Cloacimonetes bacterium]|nr:xanthine dehydrogenase family protein molybdopterin-binding subunit [Candidatus Cloacimonadota bacterium]